MNTESKKHHRRSIRLKDYDYSEAGAYFVTICTHARECRLGEIVQDEMMLSEAGRIVEFVWQRLPFFFSNVETDAFVVMPNHVHGIVVIVGAKQRADSQGNIIDDPAALPLRHGTLPHSLPAIVQNIKSVTTKRINQMRGMKGEPVWQRNYYEHIIRNERGLDAIRKYIEDNPLQWTLDAENPRKSKPSPRRN